MKNPKIYVGTYRKYNEGSLDGGWLSLRDYANYDELVAAMKRLHGDEADPELMIQDCEEMPDGLTVMESISREEFDDIMQALKEEDGEAEGDKTPEETPACSIIDYSEKAIAVTGETRRFAAELKRLGGRFNSRLSCGPGWIFSKRKEAELRAFLAGSATESSAGAAKVDSGKANPVWEAARKTLEEYVSSLESESDRKYYGEYYQAALKVPEGYILFRKPQIETKFCFHDEGPQYDFYKELMAKEDRLKNYFISENLNEIRLPEEHERLFLRPTKYLSHVDTVCTDRSEDSWYFPFRKEDGYREATTEEMKTYTEILKEQKELFRKRLDTYLKRYGTKKLHTWTYWADA